MITDIIKGCGKWDKLVDRAVCCVNVLSRHSKTLAKGSRGLEGSVKASHSRRASESTLRLSLFRFEYREYESGGVSGRNWPISMQIGTINKV